jgi:hypothetical protein
MPRTPHKRDAFPRRDHGSDRRRAQSEAEHHDIDDMLGCDRRLPAARSSPGMVGADLEVAVAGRVAEEIVPGTITTGAEADIQQLTAIARQIVRHGGMSDAMGLVAVPPANGDGRLLGATTQTAGGTQ